MEHLRKYNTATHVYIPIVKRGVVDHAVSADWTPAAGDVMVSIDGGAFANIGTLPVAIAATRGACWDFVFTGGETTGKKIYVEICDAATKAIEDQAFTLITYGNASAEIVQDISASVAQTGDGYAVVNSGTFGNAKLVRSATPANALVVDAAGLADANMVKAGPTGAGTAQTARDLGGTLGVAGAGLTAIPDLAGVTTLLARLTNTRAGLLDNLDAAISSRSTYAGADTAGTTTLLARLTAIRAGLLDNLDAAISSRSTYAGGDTSGVTTLLGRLTNTRAALLDNIDATISSRSTYAGADTAGTTTLLARLTAIRAGLLDNLDAAISLVITDVLAVKAKTDNLPASPADESLVIAATNALMAAITALNNLSSAQAQAATAAALAAYPVPTATQNADALLDRNMATGADTSSETVRTPRQALRFNRNKVDLPNGIVYKEDDATASHHFVVTTDPTANPVTVINPTGGG